MRLGAALALLVIAADAGAAHAQAAADFGSLAPGQVVRVRTVGRSRFETRLGGTVGDSLPLLFAGADIPFEAGRVDSLWVRGRATVTGAIVGGAVLTPLSFLFWWWVCDVVGEGTGCDAWGTVAGLAVAGGAGGALLGAGVGSLVPRWRLRYARQAQVTVAPLLAPGRIGVAVRY